VILGLDTSTPATSVAILREDGSAREARHDPAPGERAGHSQRLLALIAEVAEHWDAVERVAVGLGPGGFTGLRIGIATARALAQARDLPVAGVCSLDALAAAADRRPLLALIDARRGEVFAAAYDDAGERDLEPCALAPQAAARLAAGRLAVGDGAIRFRASLEEAGAVVPADADPVHRVSAVQVCRLAARAAPADRDALVPLYVREPDAIPRPAQP
jgi:tRNA threonylcarbamoyladenosine biosynthesis protein TsaB